MTNAVYPLWKQEIEKGTANNVLNSTEGATGVYVALIDNAVRGYNSADQFYSTMASAVVGTPMEILNKTQALGVFDGDDVTFVAVSGATCEALLLYRRNAGANTTWPLIAYIDTGITNLPVTPNGGDITTAWDAAGIFQL